MHQALVAKIVSDVRERYQDGDCPTIKQPGAGMMENCISNLADEIDDALILLSHIIAGQPCDEEFVQKCLKWSTQSYASFAPAKASTINS